MTIYKAGHTRTRQGGRRGVVIVIIPEQGAAFRIRSTSGAALIRKAGQGGHTLAIHGA